MTRILMTTAAHYREQNVKEPLPTGQVQFDVAGTHQWTCPEGVTKVCLAMVGVGGSGQWENARIGAGANTRYINDIEVVPGRTYTFTIPNQRSVGATSANNNVAAFGFTAASPLSGSVKGADGFPSASYVGSTVRYGGSAGLAGRGTTGNGLDLKTFNSVAGETSTRPNGGHCGGGGGFRNSTSGIGGNGGIRIIWGDNRAFPDLNIGDM